MCVCLLGGYAMRACKRLQTSPVLGLHSTHFQPWMFTVLKGVQYDENNIKMLFRATCFFDLFRRFRGMSTIGKYPVTVRLRYVYLLPKFCVLGSRLKKFQFSFGGAYRQRCVGAWGMRDVLWCFGL